MAQSVLAKHAIPAVVIVNLVDESACLINKSCPASVPIDHLAAEGPSIYNLA